MRNDYILIRTSTTEQTPELQLSDIHKAFSTSSALIIQEQVSAYKPNMKRPEIDRLKKLICGGKVNAIYVWDLDRLYRKRKQLGSFLEMCKNFNTQLFSVNQQWLNDLQNIQPPFNEIMYSFMLQIMGWLAEDESDKKSKRVKLAIRRDDNGITKSHNGKKWGRKSLSNQTVNKVKELHESGLSVRQIAEQVKVYDKSNNHRQVSKSAVHKILTNSQREKHSN